ncbi:MAG: LptE family protein [Acidobacteria bacterium]|nr:LptE family protein [Acidobacteriota bacterium]
MNRIVFAALAVLLVLLPTGCGYHLAGRGGNFTSILPSGTQSIGIPPLRNDTERPELELRITEALSNEFVQRGKLRALPSADGADVVLEGVILSYRPDPVTFSRGGRYERVEVTITASMRLVQSSPEKVLWSQNHFVFRQQYDVPPTPTAQFDVETVAIDQIATDFARSVITSILEGF